MGKQKVALDTQGRATHVQNRAILNALKLHPKTQVSPIIKY